MVRIAIAATLYIALASGAFAQTSPAAQPHKNAQRTPETSTDGSNKPNQARATSDRGSGINRSAQPNWGQKLHHRRRPHLRAIPRS
jgi:hypothetical protein